MVRYYRRQPFGYTYAPRQGSRGIYGRPRPQRKRRLPTLSVMTVLANALNNAGNAQAVQQVLTLHVPGAVQSWQGVAYKLYAGSDLQTLIDNAYNGVTNLQIKGLTATIRMDSNSTCLIAFKDDQTKPYRVITGMGYVKGNFRFNTLPYAIMLVGETDTQCKLKFSYGRDLVKSAI